MRKLFIIKTLLCFLLLVSLPSGDFLAAGGKGNYPWPIKAPFAIGNLYHTVLTEPYPYFHHGVDLLARPFTNVYSVSDGDAQLFLDPDDTNHRSGVVVYEDNGLVWLYLHLKPSSITTKLDWMSNRRARVKRGELLGIVAGQIPTFPHLHLELWNYHRPVNPMLYLKPLKDTKKPEIGRIHFYKNNSDERMKPGTAGLPVLYGDVDIVAEVRDWIPPSPYTLTPYRIDYRVEPLDEDSEARGFRNRPYRFDTLPGLDKLPMPRNYWGIDPYLLELKGKVFSIFKFSSDSQTYSHFTRRKRRYFYILTNSMKGKISEEKGYWNTDRKRRGKAVYPDGRYRITVSAYDYAGNKGEKSVDVLVENEESSSESDD
ncbi:MAG: M23 family metallopeptidase [Spirochaetota bacterium]|nr:M23 family metallopeptidase [Spirochaetota bacterium]